MFGGVQAFRLTCVTRARIDAFDEQASRSAHGGFGRALVRRDRRTGSPVVTDAARDSELASLSVTVRLVRRRPGRPLDHTTARSARPASSYTHGLHKASSTLRSRCAARPPTTVHTPYLANLLSSPYTSCYYAQHAALTARPHSSRLTRARVPRIRSSHSPIECRAVAAAIGPPAHDGGGHAGTLSFTVERGNIHSLTAGTLNFLMRSLVVRASGFVI